MTDSGARWDMSAEDPTNTCEMRDYNGEQYPFCMVCDKWADEAHMTSAKHKKKVDNVPQSSMQIPGKVIPPPSMYEVGMFVPQMCLQLPNHAGAFTPAVGINCTSGRYLPGAVQHPVEVNYEQVSGVLAEQIEEMVEKKLNQKMSAVIRENETLKLRVQHLEEYVAWWGYSKATCDEVCQKGDFQRNW